MARDNTYSPPFAFYLTIGTIVVIFGTLTAIVLSGYEMNLLFAIVLLVSILLSGLLVTIATQMFQLRATIRISFTFFPCKHGVCRRKSNGEIDVCHRCIPFYGTLIPSIAMLLGLKSFDGTSIWEPVHNFLIGNLDVTGYGLLIILLLSAPPIETGIFTISKKRQPDELKWITSVLCTLGITLAVIFSTEFLTNL